MNIYFIDIHIDIFQINVIILISINSDIVVFHLMTILQLWIIYYIIKHILCLGLAILCNWERWSLIRQTLLKGKLLNMKVMNIEMCLCVFNVYYGQLHTTDQW